MVSVHWYVLCRPRRETFIDMILGSPSHNNILEGPEIEEMIGLPAGCALEVSIWAEPVSRWGAELVTYQGTDGANRYPRANPGLGGYASQLVEG